MVLLYLVLAAFAILIIGSALAATDVTPSHRGLPDECEHGCTNFDADGYCLDCGYLGEGGTPIV